jgi:hypothetical protein
MKYQQAYGFHGDGSIVTIRGKRYRIVWHGQFKEGAEQEAFNQQYLHDAKTRIFKHKFKMYTPPRRGPKGGWHTPSIIENDWAVGVEVNSKGKTVRRERRMVPDDAPRTPSGRIRG